MKLYVEGGGDGKDLQIACREGFRKFLEKAGLAGKMPRTVACGGRQNAYDSFCTAIENGEEALLLIDSEELVAEAYQQGEPVKWKPWDHLRNRKGDQWEKPDKAADEDCHLMVQCMEAWFVADRDILQQFFGPKFNAKKLPAKENQIEKISKDNLYQSLENATRDCETKGAYGKGEHSFKILTLISPDLVIAASPWAKRFIDIMKARMCA